MKIVTDLLGQRNSATSRIYCFMMLCKAFVLANIPFYKLGNNVLRDFLQKYTGTSIPEESRFINNNIERYCNKAIETVILWFSVDKTTDFLGS